MRSGGLGLFEGAHCTPPSWLVWWRVAILAQGLIAAACISVSSQMIMNHEGPGKKVSKCQDVELCMQTACL